MAGRKPLGPGLVEHLTGSAIAKTRLRRILETIAGQLTIDQACTKLGIHQAMFYKLRTRVLQTCLADLEPKSPGRPARPLPPEVQRRAELAAENATLRRELAAQQVRWELAHALPHLVHAPAERSLKKTTRPPASRRKKR